MKLSILLMLVFSIFFTACSSKEVIKEKPTIVFPSYPEEPRILYLDTYRGGIRLADEGSSKFSDALDAFLGEKKGSKNSVATFIKPYGVGLQNGKLYVVDTGSDAVMIVDEKNLKLDYIGKDPVGMLSAPVSIAFDAEGSFYVSDFRRKTVQGYKESGEYFFAIGGRLEFVHPAGIAIDKKQNRLYVVDTKAHHIKAFDLATKELLYTIGKRGKGEGEFNFPTNVAVDQKNGNIVVTDTQNFRVQVFDRDGKFIRMFGKVGNQPGMFARPKGVAIDSEGHIYVGDSAFSNIQIFDETGRLLLYFGGAGISDTRFRLISGMYIDEDDKIAVADGFTGRVQTFQYLSEKWKAKNPEKYKALMSENPVLPQEANLKQ